MKDELSNQYLDIARHRVEAAMVYLEKGHGSLARRHLEKLCFILCWGDFSFDSPASDIIDNEHKKAMSHLFDVK